MADDPENKEVMDTDPFIHSEGNADGNADGGDGGTAKEKDAAAEELINLTVNKETRRVTKDELKTYAQKYLGSEDKFRQAAEIRSQATPAIEFQQAYNRLKSSGQDSPTYEQDMRKVADFLGVDSDALLNTNIEDTTQQASQTNQQSNLQGPLDMSKMPKEVRDAIELVKDKQRRDLRENIENDLKKSIALDPELGKIINELEKSGSVDSAKVEAIKKTLFDIALGDVQNQLFLTTNNYGPEMRLRVLQSLRSKANSLGISQLGKSNKFSAPPIAGLFEGTGNKSDAGQPPERIKATESGYTENFTKRLAYNLRNVMNR